MTRIEQKEKKEQQKADRIEEKKSKKAFNYLIRMAKSRQALVSVEYENKSITH